MKSETGTFLKSLFQIILSPARGWEDVGKDLDVHAVNVRRAYLHAFLPMLGVCAATSFFRLIYGAQDALWCLASAIITFVALFLTYHLSIYAISSLMPRFVVEKERRRPDQRKLALVVMMSVAFIALVVMFANIVKVQLAVIQLLPLYVVFILWRAAGFLNVDERQEGLYMIVASGSVLGGYYLLCFLFNMLL